MSKIEPITADEIKAPLNQLYVSDLNPRQEVSEADVIEMGESLWAAGIIQNMAGFPDSEGRIGIVAGGRRLRGLQHLASKHADLAEVRPDLAFPTVKIAPDEETARLWANTENVARRNLSPAEEIRAYGKMGNAGSPVQAIARAFAVTENHVYRRLALYKLPEAVIEALDAGDITLSAAGCFTISDDAERSLEVLERIRGYNYSDYNIKNMLKPNMVRGSDRKAKFVGEETYKDAGGILGGDLFAEEAIFDSPDILETCFAKALADAAEQAKEEFGWKWVDTHENHYLDTWSTPFKQYEAIRRVPGVLSVEQTERYDELSELDHDDELADADRAELDALQAILDGHYTDAQKALAGVVAYVNDDGALVFSGAYVKAEDQQAAVDAGVIKAVNKVKAEVKEKPAFSQKFVDDMVAIRLAATQTALLRKSEYLLDLFAFDMSPASSGTSSIFGMGHGTRDINKPDVADNFVLDPRLGGEHDDKAEAALEEMYDLSRMSPVEGFAAYRGAGKKLRNGHITAALAYRFKTQRQPFMALIMEEVGADIREIWTPSETNCFKRLNGGQLDGLFQSLLDLSDDSKALAEFVKFKKGEKCKTMHNLFNEPEAQDHHGLTDEQKARVAAWVPNCFE
ncbi:ParB/RepB/Spo0J family partition protein [Celeribacter naphthalenivorans]|uniref:ParB/RepB/Spo0J family partition protein n=1 Tax=Celeribacter naphthalenivorans TaxID=1614694 RepID=UPI001CFB3DFA|nr:ParB/Srx family N-terminal domain-containing protein [Celeribacter naphthalenivorans]